MPRPTKPSPTKPRPAKLGAGALLRISAHLAIRFYQLTLSAFVGRQCRHLPSCSDYTDEAIQRHGFWAGGWMGAARMSRCRPFGTSGYDPVPDAVTADARWWRPWRYGHWQQNRPGS